MAAGLSPAAIAVRYAAFAAAATAVNVATQALYLTLSASRHELYAGMAAGTVAGLLAKYLLDRRWIFHSGPAPLPGRSVEFVLYALTGILTTGLFWTVEIAFAAMGDALWLRYVGAVLGLAAGYTLKYRLDRRFVFRERAA